MLYNHYSKDGLHRRYAFFADEAKAGLVPTKRPFSETDRVHLERP